MRVRRSTVFLGMLAGLLLLCAALLLHASSTVRNSQRRLAANASLVRRLALTDLCLFTEASYTRHLATADLSSAFQETPMSLEHFPSGALVQPPARTPGTSP